LKLKSIRDRDLLSACAAACSSLVRAIIAADGLRTTGSLKDEDDETEGKVSVVCTFVCAVVRGSGVPAVCGAAVNPGEGLCRPPPDAGDVM
jgi:hypothetical protein